MRLVGYSRTSTVDQVAGLEAQIRDLSAAGCIEIFSEQVSSVGQRGQFEAALASMRPDDRLVVTKMDRLGRNILDIWETIGRLEAVGAGLRILNLGGETLDTRSPTGRLILTMLAGVAQFERDVMLERQREGIAKARQEGKYKGRKPTDASKIAEGKALAAAGLSVAAAARGAGVGRLALRRAML